MESKKNKDSTFYVQCLAGLKRTGSACGSGFLGLGANGERKKKEAKTTQCQSAFQKQINVSIVYQLN